MPLLLILSCLLCFFRDLTLKQELQAWSFSLQSLCLEQWRAGDWAAIGGALVCGQDLGDGELKSLFLKLGLYHLLVVSGAHLIFLAELFQAWGRRWMPAFVVGGILLGFAMMTGLGAPLVRSGFEILLRRTGPDLARKERLFLSLLGALSFYPPWIHSLSLALSFAAGLALSLSTRPGRQALWMIALTLPLVIGFGTTNPLGLLMGFLLSSAFESFLFPISLIVIWSSHLQLWTEPILQGFLHILRDIASLAPEAWKLNFRLPASTLWLYMAAIYLLTPFPTPVLRQDWIDGPHRPKAKKAGAT